MAREASRSDVPEMATLLEFRKKHNQRTVLFLGARAGGLFRSQQFYDTLRRFSKQNFAELSRFEQFGECYQVLQEERLSERDRFSILSSSLRGVGTIEADVCLAKLVKDGDFDVVISTNIDDLAEQAFTQVGMRELEGFQVLIPRRGTDLSIIHSQKNVACWLVKTFGDLPSHSYNIVKRHTHLVDDEYPQLRKFLEDTLAGDILVIGLDPVWDAGILAAFPNRGGSYWFVNEQELADHPLVVHTWWGRNVKYIAGAEGSYESFLRALYGHLSKESVPVSHEVMHDNDQGQTTRHNQPVSQQGEPGKDITGLSAHKGSIADVLLVTVTEVEARAVLDQFPEARLRFIGDRVYYDLGVIGGAKTFMVQSWMGAGGSGGALLTVAEGIQAVLPTAVVMVGIAFGFHPKKLRIGDILISQQLLGYDLQRVGTGSDDKLLIHPRGDRVSASVRLLDRFKAGKLTSNLQDWPKSPRIEFGLVLSGSKLVDNQDFRDQLRTIAPEALGGEMEGAGLLDAAHRYKVDWILVKAICDWADGKKHVRKDERQRLAAENAARFTIQVIQQGGFADQRRQEKS
jgi:nucleoside phosphorylase